MVVEILHQVGFERANRQALQALVDLAMHTVAKGLNNIKHIVDAANTQNRMRCEVTDANTTESDSVPHSDNSTHNECNRECNRETENTNDNSNLALQDVLQRAIIAEYTGCKGSYKREELVSFLDFQANMLRQIQKDTEIRGSSLLEALRIGEERKTAREDKHRALVDYTEQEDKNTKEECEEKKYLDKDVRDYLTMHATLQLCTKYKATHNDSAVYPLDQPIVVVNKKKKEYMIRENMRDYEYMLSKKRLTAKHWTPCETRIDMPFLEDIMMLSTTRRVKKSTKSEQNVV